MAYRPENYLNYDLIIEYHCCNDFRFEEDSKVHCKEFPSSSQTPAKPYIYTTEMSVEHTIYALSEGCKASWNTSLYFQYSYEIKHPERNAFKPPPEESTEVGNGYRKRCNYEVKDNLLYKKYRAKPSKLIPTQGNILHYISDAHKQTMHGGIKATYKKLSETVTGITRDDVQWLLERCRIFFLNRQVARTIYRSVDKRAASTNGARQPILTRTASQDRDYRLHHAQRQSYKLYIKPQKMGNKVSKPARKLQGTIVNTSNLGKKSAQRIQLPSQDLKDKFEQSASHSASESEAANKDAGNIEKDDKSAQHTSPWKTNVNQTSFDTTPEGKDGMDPQVDENFIKFINTLGRQIHSHTDSNPGHQSDVRALKQLLNRKRLYEKGQDEVKAQLETSDKTRSMIHPRTLTAIIYALNDVRVTAREIAKDYQVQEDFLNNLSRFKVADNVVVIEETTKADEIGPKSGQPVARAASDPSLMDENGTVSVSVNQEQLRKLRSRLE